MKKSLICERLVKTLRNPFMQQRCSMNVIRCVMINRGRVSSFLRNHSETRGFSSTHLESVSNVLLIAHPRDAKPVSYSAPQRGQELISVCK